MFSDPVNKTSPAMNRALPVSECPWDLAQWGKKGSTEGEQNLRRAESGVDSTQGKAAFTYKMTGSVWFVSFMLQL